MAPSDSEAQNLSWLLKLRWGALLAQLAVFFAGDRLTHAALPVTAILGVVGLQMASNAGGMLWLRRARRVPELAVVGVMAADCVVLTVLLYLSGSDSSPFAVLYLVNIALAGVLLRPRWTWTLLGLAVTCCSVLFLLKSHLPQGRGAADTDPVEWQLREAWLAFGVSCGLLVYFLQRTTRMLRDRERAVEKARQAMERREKLASLATLAAGAAHELGTPLGTIALVSRELERQLAQGIIGPETLADARLIREEVERCRGILSQMAMDAGAAQGDAPQSYQVVEWVGLTLATLTERGRVELVVDPSATTARMVIPARALGQTLLAVVKNALQACGEEAKVSLHVAASGHTLRLEVRDPGPGMDAATLARAGEPFFTTKEPGRGMGLGLFLARATLEQLGGRLELSSRPGEGTTALLIIPSTQSARRGLTR